MHQTWDKPYGINGKIYANIFLDDRGGLESNYEILDNAYHIVRKFRKENEIPGTGFNS